MNSISEEYRVRQRAMEIVKLKAMYEGLKGNVQLKKMTDQYP